MGQRSGDHSLFQTLMRDRVRRALVVKVRDIMRPSWTLGQRFSPRRSYGTQFSVTVVTPAATFNPTCPSYEVGCNMNAWLDPPSRTFSPSPIPTEASALTP